MSRSVRFDRAVEFYDETRGYDAELARATTELLTAELRGRGRMLEVGVGTGLIALPLHEAGIAMLGLDISAPMVGKLVEKAGGRPPFPIALGDATLLPFPNDVVDAGLIRWVLHLIPNWQDAVAELARVIRPGGVLVVHLGTYGGPRDEIHRRFEEVVGFSVDPVGLGWGAETELDAEVALHSGRLRMLPQLTQRSEEPLAGFLDGIERGLYSWTWPVLDDVRLAAVGELRPWAEQRFGPLDRPQTWEGTIVWRAYDLP